MRPFVKTPSPLHFDKVSDRMTADGRVLVSFATEMHVRCRRDGEMIRESVGNISRPVGPVSCTQIATSTYYQYNESIYKSC
jgi:hypothetical protein